MQTKPRVWQRLATYSRWDGMRFTIGFHPRLKDDRPIDALWECAVCGSVVSNKMLHKQACESAGTTDG